MSLWGVVALVLIDIYSLQQLCLLLLFNINVAYNGKKVPYL